MSWTPMVVALFVGLAIGLTAALSLHRQLRRLQLRPCLRCAAREVGRECRDVSEPPYRGAGTDPHGVQVDDAEPRLAFARLADHDRLLLVFAVVGLPGTVGLVYLAWYGSGWLIRAFELLG